MKICFFNHFHNGDLLATKEFVREFVNNVPLECYYAHNRHPKNLADISNLTQAAIPKGLPTEHKFVMSGDMDILFVNTWIAAYCSSDPQDPEYVAIDMAAEGINWKAYYKEFQHIIKTVNKLTGNSYQLRDSIESYAHKIDFSVFNCSNIDAFLSKVDSKNLVLISNGFVESDQNILNNDMSAWINVIAREFQNKIFICTRKFMTSLPNVLFTEDIISNGEGHDMNEIAYLSKFVNVVMGRNSGPFLFTNTFENLNDKNKKFLVFGRYYNQSFPAYLNFDCDFRFVIDESDSIVLESMRKLLSEV